MVGSTVGGGNLNHKCQLLPISNPIGRKFHVGSHIYKCSARVKQKRDWVMAHFGISKMAAKLTRKKCRSRKNIKLLRLEENS